MILSSTQLTLCKHFYGMHIALFDAFSLFFTISKLTTSEDFSANFIDALPQILLTGQAAK